MEDAGSNEEVCICICGFCGGVGAAEYLSGLRGAGGALADDGGDAVFCEPAAHVFGLVGVLDGGDDADAGIRGKCREGGGEDVRVYVLPERDVDDVFLRGDGCVADVDEDVGIGEGVKCEVACAPACVTADGYVKSFVAECFGKHCGSSLESFGKLDSDAFCVAGTEISYEAGKRDHWMRPPEMGDGYMVIV